MGRSGPHVKTLPSAIGFTALVLPSYLKGTINKKIARFDITAVYTHPDAKVDIVLVHGLNGEPQRTWSTKNKNGVFWPADLLPKSLEEDNAPANVLVYGYNADVSSKRHGTGPSTNYIHQHAQTLVTFLTTYRKSKKTTRNPIIWVAHSLGGILLKRALEYSDSVRLADHEDYRSIYVSTYGIIFLGTPHDGSELASWGSALQGMAGHIPRKFFDTEPVLIETLRKDNETLDNINMNFLNIYQRFKIHMVHENQKTDLKGTKSLIVDAKSAAPRLPGVTSYGIEADHSGMCKFESVDAPGYRQVSTAIVEWVQESPDFINIRWNVEDEDRRVRVQLEINERARPFFTSPTGGNTQIAVHRNETSSNIPFQQEQIAPPSPLPLLPEPRPSEPNHLQTQDSTGLEEAPLFIHPEAFRPNSYFVGRKEELEDLHRMLQDRKRRSEGTSTVLIRCQTGGGKTHMARQYVFQHKDDYPGGIFWLRATSVQELDGEYWRVARTAALKDLMNETDLDELRDHTKIVDLVRRWFNGLEGWLMVLDGIMFDTPGIERFVPDAVNSSLILTSTDPAATGDHHFNNPQLLQLPLLTVQDSQELLLRETEKKKPWSQDDRRQATELVLMLGRLPLMIHVTAQNLKANQEPLGTFLKRYRNKPKVGKVQAYEYVLEQLHARGATAALNVMSILVFFNQTIPVEMMALGLRALGKELPYKTRDAATHGRPSLSNTLRVLIAFALVDRTESRDISPSSSRSSSRSLDLPSESLDSLWIHNVIQIYFIESLVEQKQHAFWLERAVQVFFKAFHEADRRIKENPRVGLPDDYRRFYVHGKRLVEHLVKYEKRHAELRQLREGLEKKLECIHADIHSLSTKIQAMIVEDSSEIPQASIFDRVNSLSESDSATSSSQNQSQQDSWTHMDDDDPRFFHSPTSFGPDMICDMYGLPIPYPDTTTIPGPSFQDEDGGDPTPHVTPKMGSNTTEGVSSDFPQNGWTTVVPKDHTQHRQTSDSLISQNHYKKGYAQVGISHEVARTPFFHTTSPQRASSRSSSNGRLSAQSEAELALSKLRRVSPPPPRGGGAILDKGRSLSSNSSVRPKDIMSPGEYNYARVASGLTPTDEMSQAEFYRDYGSRHATDSSYTAATLKKFKENLVPFTGSSTSEVRSTPESIKTSPGLGGQPAIMPPFPVVAGSRTARSSPGQPASPFYPPGLPVEQATAADVHRTLPPSFQQWNTQPYDPSMRPVVQQPPPPHRHNRTTATTTPARPAPLEPSVQPRWLHPDTPADTPVRPQPPAICSHGA
ncbi:Protein SERAC1 [Cytospora mali]|uniref:Protein SERAC1 n=1 Tax=Cytospora mali TaxID=578113 RepID=A0A194W8L7_CYTMA|nr:Protein SERAC1 [Valsa mali]